MCARTGFTKALVALREGSRRTEGHNQAAIRAPSFVWRPYAGTEPDWAGGRREEPAKD